MLSNWDWDMNGPELSAALERVRKLVEDAYRASCQTQASKWERDRHAAEILAVDKALGWARRMP